MLRRTSCNSPRQQPREEKQCAFAETTPHLFCSPFRPAVFAGYPSARPVGASARATRSPTRPALRCRRLRCWRTFRPRCSRQSSRTSICRACGRCVASRTPCVRSSAAATSRRHGTLSGASRLTRRQPAPWRLTCIARAACLGLPQLSAHLCPPAAWGAAGRDWLLFRHRRGKRSTRSSTSGKCRRRSWSPRSHLSRTTSWRPNRRSPTTRLRRCRRHRRRHRHPPPPLMRPRPLPRAPRRAPRRAARHPRAHAPARATRPVSPPPPVRARALAPVTLTLALTLALTLTLTLTLSPSPSPSP